MAPVPGPSAEQGARVAKVDQGAWAAMTDQGARGAHGGSGIRGAHGGSRDSGSPWRIQGKRENKNFSKTRKIKREEKGAAHFLFCPVFCHIPLGARERGGENSSKNIDFIKPNSGHRYTIKTGHRGRETEN